MVMKPPDTVHAAAACCRPNRSRKVLKEGMEKVHSLGRRVAGACTLTWRVEVVGLVGEGGGELGAAGGEGGVHAWMVGRLVLLKMTGGRLQALKSVNRLVPQGRPAGRGGGAHHSPQQSS